MKSPALRLAVAALLLSGLPSSVVASGYWYLGLGTGLSYGQLYPADFNINPSAVPQCAPPASCTETKEEYDAGFKGFVGYQINRSWAFEVSVNSVGKFNYKASNGSVTQESIYKVSGWGFALLPTIPFGQKFSLYGKLGGFSSTARMTIHNKDFVPGNSTSGAQHSELTPLTGFGAQYFFDEESGIRFEFENYGTVGCAISANTNCTGRANVKMLSVNLLFPF
jgi:hypothetical protein